MKIFSSLIVVTFCIAYAHAESKQCTSVFQAQPQAHPTIQIGSTIQATMESYKKGVYESRDFVYIGKIGDQHYAMNWGFPALRILDKDFVSQYQIKNSKSGIPAIEKQTSPDNCAETALRFILKLKNVPVDSKSLGIAPSQMDPFGFYRKIGPLGIMGIAEYQSFMSKNIPRLHGLSVTNLRGDQKKLLEAIRAGKTIFVGSRSSLESIYVLDKNGDLNSSTSALLPNVNGNSGHATVITKYFVKDSEEYILLADPYSGLILPLRLEPDLYEAIYDAFIVE